MRCLIKCAAGASKVSPAEIIHQNHHDIGWPLWSDAFRTGLERDPREQEKNCRETQSHHTSVADNTPPSKQLLRGLE